MSDVKCLFQYGSSKIAIYMRVGLLHTIKWLTLVLLGISAWFAWTVSINWAWYELAINAY